MSKKPKIEHPTYSEGDKVVSLRDRYWWPFTPGLKQEKALLVTAGTVGTVTRTNVLSRDSYEVQFEGVFTTLIVGVTGIAAAPISTEQAAQVQA